MHMFTRVIVLTGLALGVLGFQHDRDQAISFVEKDLVDRSLVVVKLKPGVNKDEVIAGITTPPSRTMMTMQSRPMFSNATRRFPPSNQVSELRRYHYLDFAEELSKTEAKVLIDELFATPGVLYAYFQPVTRPAVIEPSAPPAEESDEETPDYEDRQHYLDPAPRGVNARYTWKLPGGRGSNVRVVDVEVGWNESHEDFRPRFYDNGINADSRSLKNHGTAVWGEIAAKNDGTGITGIAHEAEFGTAGTVWDGDWEAWRETVADALDDAMAQLDAGDVIIIEQHAPGPENGNYTAVEYWEPIFDVIKAATDAGIHVVAAAGNGDSDLDHDDYEGAFDLTVRDSGAILVGAAGAPGDDQHLKRLYFSNYGSRVGVFAYGEDVVTTGYGDLFRSGEGGYTSDFGGTSSATPIVTGVVANLSSIAKQRGERLTPRELRDALRQVGTPQSEEKEKSIGRMPDLEGLVDHLFD